jgi:hypothetical protein
VTDAADFESLLRRALAPVEPPADLTDRLESRLVQLTELAADELDAFEADTLRDPRNWTRVARPAAAAVVGAGAGTALVLLRKQRRARREAVPRALDVAQRLLKR